MIDAEGEPMCCAYCLLAAAGNSSGPPMIREQHPPEGADIHVAGPTDLAARVDGRRRFYVYDIGETTCRPATVINGTWVCALHIRDAAFPAERRYR